MMKRLEFTVDIQATPAQVWAALWEPANYAQWVQVFGGDSTAISTWNEGSEVRFVDAEGSGLLALIARNRPPQEMRFVHQGELKLGELQPGEWAGAEENYLLKEKQDGHTLLKAEMETTEDYAPFFEEKYPTALQVVKRLAEQG